MEQVYGTDAEWDGFMEGFIEAVTVVGHKICNMVTSECKVSSEWEQNTIVLITRVKVIHCSVDLTKW